MNLIVHAELSWLLSQTLPSRRDRVLVTCAGLAPDLDGLSLLGGIETYGRFHHVLFHGYVGALVTGLMVLSLARRRARAVTLALLAFHLHVLCDLAGSGPGWPILYFWPSSHDEWFWRGQWDLASWQNALIGLIATLTCLGAALVWQRTVLELLSPRWDGQVVSTVRGWFGKTTEQR